MANTMHPLSQRWCAAVPLWLPVGTDQCAQIFFRRPGRRVSIALHPRGSCAYLDAVRGPFRRKRVGHQCVARAVVQLQRLPASAGNGHHWPLARGYIASQHDLLNTPIGMEDEVVHWSTLDKYVRVIRG